MEQVFDEETISVVEPNSPGSDHLENSFTPLGYSNALKNQARFSQALKHGQLFQNPLLDASSQLLSLCVSVKRMQQPEDMLAYRTGLKSAITELKYQIAKLDYPPSVSDKSCFLLAVMLDEQIMHSSWGEDAGWEHQTLVAELFGIKNGGEQFYVLAERALLQPVLLADLLELIYILLKMGFRGRYRETGKEQVNVLYQRLEESVFARQSEEPNVRIASVDADIDSASNAIKPKKPVRFWRYFALFFLSVVVTWSGLQYWYDAVAPQRALPFTTLEDFSKPFYFPRNEEREYIYRSTTDELKVPPGLDGITGVEDIGLKWIVQLAIFSSRSDAERFIAWHQVKIPNSTVQPWKGKFRVISINDTKEGANQILGTAKASGITDAFMLSEVY
ncbi:type IVB secretion system protein IcmH/DotU [Vibrio sp. SCSIO 43136]|uniref:type IVB secretion system protein IcmH/DotU n=1 Tax=Vibrio sp. SCSIO 43136 TaxID=2819101 RepID=UPI0020755ADC|nr:type IVB secretion system protein IcmH/DotU [Vibrio sp. SCSIO 43136]USD66351.1 type IVB secretion system protein IcmH/DotU [Vibrio sp. SCSIO 43136]